MTATVDGIARRLHWMRAETPEYPTLETILRPFASFRADIRPLWARMPYDTFVFTFARKS